MTPNRRPLLAVVGAAGRIGDVLEELAVEVGRLAVDAGFRLVTGGLDGVMAAASRGAHESAAWSEGAVVGVLPSYDRSTANQWIDIVVPTGLQLGRNIVVVAMADVVIGIGGGAGTLSELALAWQLAKPVVVLAGGGGWSEELAGRTLDHRHEQALVRAESPRDAVLRAGELTRSGQEAGDIGSGWRGRVT